MNLKKLNRRAFFERFVLLNAAFLLPAPLRKKLKPEVSNTKSGYTIISRVIFPGEMSLREYEAYKRACASYPYCTKIISQLFERKLILKARGFFYGSYNDWEVTFKNRKAYLLWYKMMGKYSPLHELKAKGFRYELIIS